MVPLQPHDRLPWQILHRATEIDNFQDDLTDTSTTTVLPPTAAMHPFQPKYRTGHPQNYLFILS